MCALLTSPQRGACNGDGRQGGDPGRSEAQSDSLPPCGTTVRIGALAPARSPRRAPGGLDSRLLPIHAQPAAAPYVLLRNPHSHGAFPLPGERTLV